MQSGKGIVLGFVAGFTVACGAVLLLRDDAEPPAPDGARIAELAAQVQRLERSVTQLSSLVTRQASSSAAAGSAPSGQQAQIAEQQSRFARDPAQQRAIATADGLVDAGVQSGQWTKHQAFELQTAIADLPLEEQGRILARLSAAINSDQLRVELP